MMDMRDFVDILSDREVDELELAIIEHRKNKENLDRVLRKSYSGCVTIYKDGDYFEQLYTNKKKCEIDTNKYFETETEVIEQINSDIKKNCSVGCIGDISWCFEKY